MKAFAIALAIAVAGCAVVDRGKEIIGVGQPVGTVDGGLQIGMTQAQVTAVLGEPTQRTTLFDGSEQWMWAPRRSQATGPSSQALWLRFGPDKRFIGIMNTATPDTP